MVFFRHLLDSCHHLQINAPFPSKDKSAVILSYLDFFARGKLRQKFLNKRQRLFALDGSPHNWKSTAPQLYLPT